MLSSERTSRDGVVRRHMQPTTVIGLSEMPRPQCSSKSGTHQVSQCIKITDLTAPESHKTPDRQIRFNRGSSESDETSLDVQRDGRTRGGGKDAPSYCEAAIQRSFIFVLVVGLGGGPRLFTGYSSDTQPGQSQINAEGGSKNT